MKHITTILSILNRFDNDLDKSLYCFITTQEITKEELIFLKNTNIDNKYFNDLKERIIMYYDDKSFITYYLLSNYKYINLLVDEKYKYFYSKNRMFPYGIEYIRKLLHTIEGCQKDLLVLYVEGYYEYCKNRKKEEKKKIK